MGGLPELPTGRLLDKGHAGALVLHCRRAVRRGRGDERVSVGLGCRLGNRHVERTPHAATTRSPCTTGSATTPCTVGTETATARPDRDYVYDWTNQWFEETLQPGHHVHVAAAQRHRRGAGQPVRDAQPHARLVLPPRLHRDGVEPAGRQLRTRRATATTPSRATPRPAASAADPPSVRGARQRQPDHAGTTASRPITNMYLWQPIAGIVLRTLRRRRLRHVGDRPRVHPRHHQPDDRRTGRRAWTRRRA